LYKNNILLTSAKDLVVIAIQNNELDDQPNEPKGRELMMMGKGWS
jgi:hypothetical protein